jgi:hypothetical protein
MIQRVKRSFRTVLFRVTIRVLIYAVLLGLISAGMLWGAVVYDEAFYDETGPVEIAQTVFALITALGFLLAARRDQSKKPCAILIAGLLFCLVIRESDYFLDMFIGRHQWKVWVVLIVASMTIYAVRHIRELSVLRFTHLPSFGVFISGLLVLIVFSRLFGYGPFWKAIMDNSSFHTVKTIVEEGTEAMGYFLLLISACEYVHESRMRTRFGCKAAK